MELDVILTAKIIFCIIALVWIIWPFLRKKEVDKSVTIPQEELLNGLMLQKEHTYAAIKELDFDYNMGKLSEDDYQDLKQQLKHKAMAVLQKIDSLTKGKAIG